MRASTKDRPPQEVLGDIVFTAMTQILLPLHFVTQKKKKHTPLMGQALPCLNLLSPAKVYFNMNRRKYLSSLKSARLQGFFFFLRPLLATVEKQLATCSLSGCFSKFPIDMSYNSIRFLPSAGKPVQDLERTLDIHPNSLITPRQSDNNAPARIRTGDPTDKNLE